MTRRRDSLRALFAGEDPQAEAGQNAEAAPETKALVPAFVRPQAPPQFPSPAPMPAQQPRAASGALKAMGLELDGLRQSAGEAEALRAQLQGGGVVVEIDAALVDEAFVRDRMPADPAADAELEASLAASGQQVPVLVRPHRDRPGRYEAVYGHRRVAALRRMGRKVKALVRPMTDEELVVAQGQENNQRRDLSFIERARYAAALDARGFPRATIMAALDAHKSDIARYLSLMEQLPGALIEAIGPAPGTGRPRWMALAETLGPGRRMPAAVKAAIDGKGFQALDSDRRFAAVFAAARGRKDAAPSPAPVVWRSADGALSVERRAVRNGAEIGLRGAEAEAFAVYLGSRLEALHAEFRKARAGGDPA